MGGDGVRGPDGPPGTSVVGDPDTEPSPAELRDWVIDHLRKGDARTVVRELEALPLALVLDRLDLTLALGLAAGLSGDTVLARAMVVELHRIQQTRGLSVNAQITLAQLELGLCIWEGRMLDLAVAAKSLQAKLDAARLVDGNSSIIAESAAQSSLAVGLLGAGCLDDAVHAADQALVAAELMPVSRSAVQASGVKALALAWSGATQRSREATRQAVATLDRFAGRGSSSITVHAARCWAGPTDELQDAIEAVEAAARELPVPTTDVLAALSRAKAFIRIGDLGGALAASAAVDDRMGTMSQPGHLEVIADHMREEIDRLGASQLESLTPIEVRSLELLAGGASRSEIARELHYSINTVKANLRHAYRKLGASNRDDAIRNAQLRGVITSD